MNTTTHSIQFGSLVGIESLMQQRASIIKKAQETVRASHERMRSRVSRRI